MKKSELRQIIREEIQALNESQPINIDIWFNSPKEEKFIIFNVNEFGGKVVKGKKDDKNQISTIWDKGDDYKFSKVMTKHKLKIYRWY
jgi:hypothetical protein